MVFLNHAENSSTRAALRANTVIITSGYLTENGGGLITCRTHTDTDTALLGGDMLPAFVCTTGQGWDPENLRGAI